MDDQEVRQALAKLQVNLINESYNLDADITNDGEMPFNSSSLYGNSERYKSKWATSRARENDNLRQINGQEEVQNENDEEGASADEYDVFNDLDELPSFADEECQELCRQIRLMDIEKDEVAKHSKEHTERVSSMRDHLQNVRQEIVYTNGLHAAKQKEIDTEKHLIALADREMVAITTEVKVANESIQKEKKTINTLQGQINVANEELETLKMSLNWNQEELEQWATAAAKKESDNQALEKYRRADEVKIKELLLKLENLTKMSVTKSAEIENEKTETQSKQLEVDRITKLFKQNHEERRQLIQQWQKSIEVMKDRDAEIDKVSVKYREASEEVESQITDISKRRKEIFYIKNQFEDLDKEVERAERAAQSKRQEAIDEGKVLKSLQIEFEILKAESADASLNLQRAKAQSSISLKEVEEKQRQLELFRSRMNAIQDQLSSEKSTVHSKEKITQHAEERLQAGEKELRNIQAKNEGLREQMFKDCQHLAKLHENESNLIIDIKSTQRTIKNMSSRLQQLDQERAKQQDMIYNADFKLEQMNRKVARGLGERSTEEKERLTKRINELNEEQIASKSRNKELEQQAKILHQELKKWSRQYIECAKSNPDLQNAIIEVELEIKSCELNSEKIQRDKEEEMVALDLVRLEVRRLRDILNTKATEVYELEDAREQQRGKMNTRKNKLCEETEVMTAHLRAVEDERHHCAIEFGQRSIMAEKIQLKYEMITKAHNTGDNGDGRSQVFNLIAAAQKRADLQLEGDRLDTRIQKKETEMKAIQKTLVQLKGRNSTFRRSFARLDKESGEYKHILRLEKELEASEKLLFEVKKSAQTYVRSTESLSRELETLRTSQGKLKQENEKLDKERCSLDEDTDIMREEELTLQLKLERESSNYKSMNHHLHVNQSGYSLHELSFQGEIKEKHLRQIVRMLMEIGNEFPSTKKSIITSLTNEGIEVL